MTGRACDLAVTGHVAALPISVMNSRRLIVIPPQSFRTEPKQFLSRVKEVECSCWVMNGSKPALFNYIVGAHEDWRGYCYPDRTCNLIVDGHLETSWLFKGHLCR